MSRAAARPIFSRKWVQGLILSTASILATLIFLEIAVRLFLSPTDMPVSAYEPEVGLHLAPDQEGVFTAGPFGEVQGHYRINAQGWNNTHDYHREQEAGTLRVAVIGDSFVEALQVDVEETFFSLVEQSLQDNPACSSYTSIEVYSFGIHNIPLSQYLNLMRYAAREYDPDVYVISIYFNDFDASLNPPHYHLLYFRENADGTFEEVPPVPYQPSPVRRLFVNSALVRYVYFNLKAQYLFPQITELFRATTLNPHNQSSPDSAEAPAPASPDSVYNLTRLIFQEMRDIAANNDAPLLFFMDGDRPALYSDEQPAVHPETAMVTELTEQLGIDFIDMGPIFWADYAANGLRFESDADAHWNERGHQVVADAIVNWFDQHGCFAGELP